MEIDFAPPPHEDLCSSVLSQFSNPNNEHHLHVCAAIGAMSQEMKDQNVSLTPIAYFGATCSSLDRLSSSAAEPQAHLVDALITILFLVMDRLPPAVLKAKYVYLSDLLVRILRLKTIGESGAVPGLRCVSRLLTVSEKVAWDDVAQLYGVLIIYVTDGRSKTRKQSHTCVREVLQYFGSIPALAPLVAPASEAISNAFERFLLLAGGSSADASEGPKGAQEVVYILDALKIYLPYMSLKSSTTILKRFKSLLEVRQPLVTRRITDALNALCVHSSGEVSSEVLLDLLCSLAVLCSSNETSADSMTFTARLLDTGIRRVYSLNREICVVKLPVVFNALKDILASEQPEALVAGVATYKSLIHSCIDESLINQGVHQVTVNANVATRKSGPTVIEKICATIESLLDYQYEAILDVSFQIVSSMFDKLGKYSFYFLKESLKTLEDMQKLPDEDFTFRKELHECVGAALGAMGPENFLRLLPLNLEAQDLSEANLWLFPILKQYIVGAHLKYFVDSLLPLVGTMKRKSTLLEQQGNIQAARSVDGIVYSLWSLLPSFCNYPVDTAESFKGLEKPLCTALREDPDVRGIMCSSLQILIRQNKNIVEGSDNNLNEEASIPERRAIAFYTSQIANANLKVLKSCASELLSVLSGVCSKASKDVGGIIQNTIRELASISEKVVVTRLFTKTMRKLLKVTQEAGKSENSKNSNAMLVDNPSNESSASVTRPQLLDLAVSLLPGLDSNEIDLLFVAVKPALKDIDGLVQKKAYRVLSMILQFSDEFISRQLEELCVLMVDVLPSCLFSAKRHRLDCLHFLLIHVSKEESEKRRHDITLSFLTEIILALKEANKKTRNRAYDILVQIGHSYGDVEKGGEKEKLRQFFTMVAGGLAGETPHMISAAMTGLARLAYEFSDLVNAAYDVLPSTFLLMPRKNKEILKSCLGLLKVLVARSQAEALQAHLRSVVDGLLNWQDGTRNHFKAKVKLLLEMLVKKCGLDAVKQVMPEEHMKLLNNIRKLNDRKEKKQDTKSVESKSIISRATTSRVSKWNHTKVFSDFDDDDDETMNSEAGSRQSKYTSIVQSKASLLRSQKKRKRSRSLQEDSFDQLSDEPLDLLDRQKMRSAIRSSELVQKRSDSDDELEIDSEGRLVIHEDGRTKKIDRKLRREQPSESDIDGRSETRSRLSSANSRKDQKRTKTSESGWAYTGKEYASKKASGDLKRKDKLEPYAYWPLDRKMVSRRPEHRAAARKGIASVVKLTKNLEGKSVASALAMKGVGSGKGKKKHGQKKA